jgi:hypothetical protein
MFFFTARKNSKTLQTCLDCSEVKDGERLLYRETHSKRPHKPMKTCFPKPLFEIGGQVYRIDGIAIRKRMGESHF